MLDSNIIEWLEFGDSAQIIDVYSNKNILTLFKFLRELMKTKNFPIIINLIFISLYFIQIWTMCIINVSIEKEFLLDILNYLKKFIIIFEIINNEYTYKKIVIIFFDIIIIDLLLIIITLLTNKKINSTYFCLVINFLNIIIYYYLMGPSVDISLTSIWCEEKNHRYLKIPCFSNTRHLLYTILSFLMLLLFLFISFIYSFYCNEIELIETNSNENITRVQCNYEIYCLCSKVSIFIFGFFFYKLDYEEEEHLLIKIIYESFILINCLIMSIYTYKNVYFYNKIMNNFNHFGWYFSTWLSLGILLKSFLGLSGISNFIAVGWVIIILAINKANSLNENLLIYLNLNFLLLF